MALANYQTIVTNNDPTGSSFMDSTAGPTYLVTELQTLKADMRLLALSLPWVSLIGLTGTWTGALGWTQTGPTTATIQGDQSVASGTGYLQVGQRVRALQPGGTIYGFITNIVVASGVTTVTFAWDSGALNANVTDIQTSGDPNGLVLNSVVSQTQVPLFASITNGGAGSNFAGTLSPAISAYKTGQQYTVSWIQASQGNDTLNLNGLGAKSIKKIVGGALVNLALNDIPAGSTTVLTYDGTNFELQGITPSPSQIQILDRSVGNPVVDIANSGAETSIYSKTIPGGTLGINGALRLSIFGDFLNNTGAGQTFQIKVKFGGTTVLDTAAVSLGNAASPQRVPFGLRVNIGNIGNTNVQYVNGFLNKGNVAVNPAFFVAAADMAGFDSGLAIDTTTGQTLQVTVTLGSASATLECRVYQCYLDLVPAG